MAKTFEQLMKEIKEHRKLLAKTFVKNDTGDHYQLLMFAHDRAENCVAIFCLCAHSPFKLTWPVEDMLSNFSLFDPNQTEASGNDLLSPIT